MVGVEQPPGGHVGVCPTAGQVTGYTAGGLEESRLVRTCAGQAGPAAAAFGRGVEGGGRASGS